MPAIDRSLPVCCVYTCRRLIDLSNDCRYDNPADNGEKLPEFPLMVIGGLWERERERLEVVVRKIKKNSYDKKFYEN